MNLRNSFVNKKIFYIFLVILCFIFSFLFLLFIQPVVGDAIWNYGFSYNITNGMIPYKDFNLVITPLYSFLGSFFVKLFGNYLFSLHILSSLLITIMMVLLFNTIRWKSLILWPMVVFFAIPSYNLLSLFWVILILYLVYMKKDNDLVLGLVIGLLFLTKQNVGICLLIPGLYYSRSKVKYLLSFILPILLMLLYLISNNALYNFIDYCFLGLFEFSEENKLLGIQVIFEILILLFLFYKLVVNKFKTKEVFYILMFQVMAYPIFDAYHLCIALVPVVYYFIKDLKSIHIEIIWFCFVWLLFLFVTPYEIDVHYEKDFLFLTKNIGINLTEVESMIRKYTSNGEDYYFIGNAYPIKLYMGEKINKFDLLNNGNMGYNGSAKYIDEIDDNCRSNKCIFFVELNALNSKGAQLSKEIFNYVIDNYEKIDEYKNIGVYTD